MKVNKTLKIAIIAVPAILLIGGILMMPAPDQNEERVGFELPVDQEEIEKQENMSKQEAYRKEAERKRAEIAENSYSGRISVDELFESAKIDTAKKISKLSFQEKLDSIKASEQPNSNNLNISKPAQKKKIASLQQNVKKTPHAPQEEKPAVSGFSSLNGSGTFTASASDAESRIFYRATLEDPSVIKPKGRNTLTFILREAATIDGRTYEKMSVIHAIANFKRGMVDITSASITNTKGQNYSVYLVGHDKDRMRGIAYEGSWDEAVNSTAENAMKGRGGRLSGTAQGIAEAISSEMESIPLYQGYEMFFSVETN